MPDWSAVAEQLKLDCPDEYYRKATIGILAKVEGLGPLSTPGDEFKRVYRFIHYNEPHRVEGVADELLGVLRRRPDAVRPSKVNAWSYVVGAFDNWILRARIFYVVAGIIEGTLRSRLNAQLTAAYGSDWYNKDVVPSRVKTFQEKDTALARLVQVAGIAEGREAGDDPEQIVNAIELAILPTASKIAHGPEYLESLTFGSLECFFSAKRLWGGQARLGEIFGVSGTRPLRGDVTAKISLLRELRNEVAHYRPQPKSSFQAGLFSAAKLAQWLGVDLQHVYGSIETRLSTELSLLLDGVRPTVDTKFKCAIEGCTVSGPFDVILEAAPDTVPSPLPTEPIMCLYHRVVQRAAQHRR